MSEKLCQELDVLIREYIQKENLQIRITDDTKVERADGGYLPWRHYEHEEFKITTESFDEEKIGMTVLRGEDPWDGYMSPPLFALSQPRQSLQFFDYFVKNHSLFLYQPDKDSFHYFDEEKILEKVKNDLKLDVTDIPQRLDFRHAIRTKH